MLDGGAVDRTGTALAAMASVRCIDDVAVEDVDVTRANQRKAGASLYAWDCEVAKL
jgi:hypothetical protein